MAKATEIDFTKLTEIELVNKMLDYAENGNKSGIRAVERALKCMSKLNEQSNKPDIIKKGSKDRIFLNEAERLVYNDILIDLDEKRINKVDKHLLFAYCKAVVRYFDTSFSLDNRGLVIVYDSGAEQVRPEWSINQGSFNQMVLLAEKIVLSSAAKTKLGIDPVKDIKDPFDEL